MGRNYAFSNLPPSTVGSNLKDKYSCLLGVIILLCKSPVALIFYQRKKLITSQGNKTNNYQGVFYSKISFLLDIGNVLSLESTLLWNGFQFRVDSTYERLPF